MKTDSGKEDQRKHNNPDHSSPDTKGCLVCAPNSQERRKPSTDRMSETPKCGNCGKDVWLGGKYWRHKDTGEMRCDLYAIPRAETPNVANIADVHVEPEKPAAQPGTSAVPPQHINGLHISIGEDEPLTTSGQYLGVSREPYRRAEDLAREIVDCNAWERAADMPGHYHIDETMFENLVIDIRDAILNWGGKAL